MKIELEPRDECWSIKMRAETPEDLGVLEEISKLLRRKKQALLKIGSETCNPEKGIREVELYIS